MIISNQKPKTLDEKVNGVYEMIKEMEEVDKALNEKNDEIEKLRQRDQELDSILIPLRTNVSKKEVELEKLKNRDVSLTTQIGDELRKFESEKADAFAEIVAEKEKIAKDKEDVRVLQKEAQNEKVAVQTAQKANEEKEKKLKEREGLLDVLAGQLEEYKKRIIQAGLRRTGEIVEFPS